ncbi:MAG TPA: HlyD family type I secretion periplasmic adaptor subunit [Pirellulaceae bacterium]|nr:HlyD family type I secretion periplasmic adaptor subunit [Pirellulaceae bacterium]
MATTSGTDIKSDASRRRRERRTEMQNEMRSRTPGFQRTIVEFLPDAVEIEQRAVPGGARWTLYLVVCLLAAAVAWSCWAEVDQVVTSPGKLVTTEQPVLIQTATTVPIRAIHVQFGQVVRPGDLLATLDATFSDADVRQLEQKTSSLQALVARVTAEVNGDEFKIEGRESNRDWLLQWQAYLERQKEYRAKIEEFRAEAVKLEAQRNSSLVEILGAEEKLEILKKLESKSLELLESRSVADINVLGRQLQVKETEVQIATLNGRIAELDAEADAIARRLSAFEAGWRATAMGELLKASDELYAAQQELSKALRAQELIELRVPTDLNHHEFFVQEIAERSPGSVVQPGEALFKLVPLSSGMEVEVEIPGRDVARVRLNDEVRVKLASFPYQKHGWLNGRVRTVSESSFEKQTEQGGPAISTFRARIALIEPIELKRVQTGFRLLPGMVTDTEIKVGTRRVVEYFLYPLTDALQSSIKEPDSTVNSR